MTWQMGAVVFVGVVIAIPIVVFFCGKRCRICGRTYGTRAELQAHIVRAH